MNASAASSPTFIERWGGFVAVALAVSLGFTIGSVPTPLYPLYQAAWEIPPSALSYIFTAYMGGILAAFLCFGRLSDSIGRYRAIVLALLLIAAGLLLSALAGGVATLVVARAGIGLANGLLTTTAAMALTEAHPLQDRRSAAVTTSAAITAGFGIGPILGGGLAQVGSDPLAFPYFVLFAATLGLLALVIRTRSQLQGPGLPRTGLSISPQMALPAKPRRSAFILASLSGLATSAVVCLFASLIPPLLQKLLPWKGPMVIGATFLLLAGASAATQITQRALPPFQGLGLGMLALLLSLVSLALGLLLENVAGLALSMVLAGVGQGFGIMDSTMIAARSSDEHRRAANVSTYFFISYVGATLPIIAVGLLADRLGLAPAVLVFCVVTGGALLALAWGAFRHHRADSEFSNP